MAGAYVAKPDAVVTPDVPAGWSIYWPVPPGSFPPGYTPDYSNVFTADSSLTTTSQRSAPTINLLSKIADHLTYPTQQPPVATGTGVPANLYGTITWSATIDGNVRKVKLSTQSDSEFAEELITNIEFLNDFWAGSPSIIFQTTVADAGKYLTLTSVTSGINAPLSSSAQILITAGSTAKITIDYTASAFGEGVNFAEGLLSRGVSLYAHFQVTTDAGNTYDSLGDGYTSTSILLQMLEELGEKVYDINLGIYESASIDYTLKFYINDVLKYTESDLLSAGDRIFSITTHTNGTYEIV